jgi:hypothetical protein
MEPPETDSRIPEEEDLIAIAAALNQHGVRYIVVGGWAMNFHGCTRTTNDVNLLIARDLANQALVKKAPDYLPQRAIRELGDEDIAQWIVVRVHDDITIDLMTEACGVKFDDIAADIVWHDVGGVRIPFASPASMLRMKQSYREKDAQDRAYLVRLLDAISKQPPNK